MRRAVRNIALPCALVVSLAGCAGGSRGTEVALAERTGHLKEPFRGRWWHLYERGALHASHGQWAQAEADLRRCLRLRSRDNRFAWTYGLRFAPCFAHRELGAVLLAQGRLKEAEEQVRTSLEQEPSAKAVGLLREIEARRGKAPAPEVGTVFHLDGGGFDGVPRVGPRSDLPLAPWLTLSQIDAADAQGARLRLRGRVEGPRAVTLVALHRDGGKQDIALSPEGDFVAEVPADAALNVRPGDGAADVAVDLKDIAAPGGPRLRVDDGWNGKPIDALPALVRIRAQAAQGLGRLQVIARDGTVLVQRPLAGLRFDGMVPLQVGSGEHRLTFRLEAADGTPIEDTRELVVRPPVDSDPKLRAIASLALPLQWSGIALPPRPDDGRWCEGALSEAGRLRLAAPTEIDERLAEEIALSRAGLASASTLVKRCPADVRYVIAFTLTRGLRDIECYARLIHRDSGAVVATSDAYCANVANDFARRSFFADLAARLRHAFPVQSGDVVREGGRWLLRRGRADGVTAGLRLSIVQRDAQGFPVVGGVVEVVSPGERVSELRWVWPVGGGRNQTPIGAIGE